MKKTIFLFAFLSVSLFASANHEEVKTLDSHLTENLNTKEVTLSEEEQALELLKEMCFTRTSYWYVGTGWDMYGSYEIYDVETTTTCY